MEFLINERAVDARDFPAHLHAPGFPAFPGLDRHQGRLRGGRVRSLRGRPGCAPNGTGSAFRVVNSCLLFLPMLAGQEVYTVEGLARDGRLSEPQRAIAEDGGSQCGYCTPGFVVSLFAEYYRPGRTGPCDPHAMGGNLCRCTGYRPLRDAALSLGDAAGRRVSAPPAPARSAGERLLAAAMPEFASSAPRSLADCLALLERASRRVPGRRSHRSGGGSESARPPLAPAGQRGGRARIARVPRSADEVEIGAGLTLSEIEARWLDAPPVDARVVRAVRLAADSQSRHARRQSGHRVAGRRCGAAAARARRAGQSRRPRRAPPGSAQRVLPRLPPDRAAARAN